LFLWWRFMRFFTPFAEFECTHSKVRWTKREGKKNRRGDGHENKCRIIIVVVS